MATCRDISSISPSVEHGVDSYSILPLLLGENKNLRQGVVHLSINGSFGYKKGNWKLISCPGSGGWSAPKPKKPTKNATKRMSDLDWVQLYDLSQDGDESKNLATSKPEVVNRMTTELRAIIANGRSNNGPIQSNDGTTFLYPKWIRSAKANQ